MKAEASIRIFKKKTRTKVPHKNVSQGYNKVQLYLITRTKTSIRYAKENDKKKREGRKEREKKVEGEI